MNYDHYKPLRNFLREFDLEDALVQLWFVSQVLTGGFVATGGRPSWAWSLKGKVYPWEVSTLAREVIQNCGPRGRKDFGTEKVFVSAINRIRALNDKVAQDHVNEGNIFQEVQRAIHQQLPWQTRRPLPVMMRYHKIFGAQEVEAFLVRKTGLTMAQLYFMGLAVQGRLAREPGIVRQQAYEEFGITRELSEVFFQRMTCPLEELKTKIADVQHYDDRWPYTWNPLEASPFLVLDKLYPDRGYCPVPTFINDRISRGVYYDLFAEKGFSKPYGNAFEAYVGDVIKEIYRDIPHDLLEEQPYKDGKESKLGIDWILCDGTANVFLECKTKRLSMNAKQALGGDELQKQCDVLADAVVQTYKNIGDAIAGITAWVPNQLPIYPLVLTLEEWHLFSPPMLAMLKAAVAAKMTEKGVDPGVLESMPYTIASVEDFEITGQVMAAVGIDKFFAMKTSPDHRDNILLGFVRGQFAAELANVEPVLFKHEFAKIFREMERDWSNQFRDKINFPWEELASPRH